MKAIEMITFQQTTAKPACHIEREFNMPVGNDCCSLAKGAGS